MIINIADISQKVRMVTFLAHHNPEGFIKDKSSDFGWVHHSHLQHHDGSFILHFDSSLVDIKLYNFVDLVEKILFKFLVCQSHSYELIYVPL